MFLMVVCINCVSYSIPDEVVRVLGFDWLMLFLQGHLHASTVTLAFKLLVYVLSYPTLLARFREGFGGAWLKDEHRSSQMIGGIFIK